LTVDQLPNLIANYQRLPITKFNYQLPITNYQLPNSITNYQLPNSMPHPLYVAFIWHQHQPLYKSRVSATAAAAEYRLPWVRLHGVKDYLDLVLLLAKYPKLHQTVNLVPSLILQIEDCIADRALDPYLAVTLKPTEDFKHPRTRVYFRTLL
jgi:hypothetical protein